MSLRIPRYVFRTFHLSPLRSAGVVSAPRAGVSLSLGALQDLTPHTLPGSTMRSRTQRLKNIRTPLLLLFADLKHCVLTRLSKISWENVRLSSL